MASTPSEPVPSGTADDNEGATRENGLGGPDGSCDRGREAGTPAAIPPRGWWDIVRRVFDRVVEQNVVILSAGIGFFAMLALFPALAAVVTTYALIADPVDVAEHFATLSTVLPADVASIIGRQLQKLTGKQQGLGTGLVIGLLLAIWFARRGVDALVRAVTVAYDEPETRGLIRLTVVTYLMTLGAIVLLVITMALLVALPAALVWLPLSGQLSLAAQAGGWLLFLVAIQLALGVLYRHGPPRRPARMRWLATGTLAATVLWGLGSAGFSVYAHSFGNFNETYGTLGAIIVLLLWFFLSAFSIVLGALLNAEMEHQTARDTTVGESRPMGERGAYVADTLGKTP